MPLPSCLSDPARRGQPNPNDRSELSIPDLPYYLASHIIGACRTFLTFNDPASRTRSIRSRTRSLFSTSNSSIASSPALHTPVGSFPSTLPTASQTFSEPSLSSSVTPFPASPASSSAPTLPEIASIERPEACRPFDRFWNNQLLISNVNYATRVVYQWKQLTETSTSTTSTATHTLLTIAEIAAFNKGIGHITEALWAIYMLQKSNAVTDLLNVSQTFNKYCTDFYSLIGRASDFKSKTSESYGFYEDFKQEKFFLNSMIEKLASEPKALIEKLPNFFNTESTFVCDAKIAVLKILELQTSSSLDAEFILQNSHENLLSVIDDKLNSSAYSNYTRLLQSYNPSSLTPSASSSEDTNSSSCVIC